MSFTRALAGQLAKDGIRVNAVAPGVSLRLLRLHKSHAFVVAWQPIWTPLIPASFEKHQLENWGKVC